MQILKETRDFNRLCMNNFKKVIIIIFYADWFDQSKQYVENFEKLLQFQDFSNEDVIFAKADAESLPDVSKIFSISQVPTVIFTETQKRTLMKLENKEASIVLEQLESFQKNFAKKMENEKIMMFQKIEKILGESPVLIFIKGTPDEPQCKFTRQFLEILKDLQIKFSFYDIIADPDIRYWLKEYDNWPTFPQMFIKGKLIGGLDKVKEFIPAESRRFDPESRLKKLVSDNLVIFLMESTPQQTYEEKALDTIELLKNNGIKFNCFDLNLDDNLNKFLIEKYGKTPLLFSKGELIGSFEEIKDLSDKKQLLPKIPGSEWRLDGVQKIQFLLQSCPVITFIEGIPKETKGENSKQMIQILNKHQVLYEFYNLIADGEVQENLKKISNFDQIPQLYIDGNLIGGIEVVQKLDNDGDLADLVKKYKSN